MDYTAEQINSAFENMPSLRSKAMSRFNIDGISNEIVKKYGLDEEKGRELKTNIIFAIILLLSFEDFKQFVIKETGLTYENATNLVNDVDKLLLTPIKDKIEDFENEKILIEEIEKRERELKTKGDEIEVPLPPYNKSLDATKVEKEEPTIQTPTSVETPKTEEGIYKNSGIEMIEEEVIPEDEVEILGNQSSEGPLADTKAEIFRNNILENSGIDVVEEPIIKQDDVIPKEETDKVLIEDIEHPESIAKNILMDKLKGGSVSNTVVSDHSIPKITSNK